MAIKIWRVEGVSTRVGPFTGGMASSTFVRHRSPACIIDNLGDLLPHGDRFRRLANFANDRRMGKGWIFGWDSEDKMMNFINREDGYTWEYVYERGFHIVELEVEIYNRLPDGQVMFLDPRLTT